MVKLKKTSSCVQFYASPLPLYVYMACQQLLTFSITFLRVGRTLENLQHSAVKLFNIIWKGLLLKDCRQKRPFNSYFHGKNSNFYIFDQHILNMSKLLVILFMALSIGDEHKSGISGIDQMDLSWSDDMAVARLRLYWGKINNNKAIHKPTN